MPQPTTPQPFLDFTNDFPAVAEAYAALGSAAHDGGPLDERTRRLVKLAIAIGGRLEGAVRAQARAAVAAGISHTEMDHLILLAVTTVGLPSAVAARTWVRDEVGAPRATPQKRKAPAPRARRSAGR